MKILTSLIGLTLACLLCIPNTKAEGLFTAELTAIDDSQWPQVNLLLKVTNAGLSPGYLRYESIPFGCEARLEQPGRSCWKIDLSENGRVINEFNQISAPPRPRDDWNYLWLSYRSKLDSLDEGSLTIHLDIPEWGFYSSPDQPLLYLHQAREPGLAGAPWKYLHIQSDRLLNTNYQRLLEVMPENHAELLRQAQRAWLHFRDTECSKSRSTHQQRCLYLRTQERAESLQRMLSEKRRQI